MFVTSLGSFGCISGALSVVLYILSGYLMFGSILWNPTYFLGKSPRMPSLPGAPSLK